jgi:SAM-dependent methyltransferase
MSELERWNDRYAAPGYLFGEGPNAYLAAQAGRLPARGTALCVADGDGRNSVWLAERGLEVTAFDFSPVAVAKARELAARRGVKVAFDVADVAGWRWPAAAHDVVAAIFVQFAEPALRAVMFERMVRALKPGGLLIVQGYTPKQLEYRTGGPSQVENLYTAKLLRAAFASLEEIELVEYEAALEEGERHVGLSALVGLVARKPAV